MFARIALLLVFSASLPAQAPPPAPAAATEITHVLEQQAAAWNRGDLQGYMAGYWRSPELSFYSGATATRGWEQTLERYRKRYQGEGREMGRLEFSGLQIDQLAGDAALVRGQWALALPGGKRPHGLFTLLVRRMPEGWRIVHDHSSGE